MQASQDASTNSQKNQLPSTKINQCSKIPRLIPTKKKINVTTTNSTNLGKKTQLHHDGKSNRNRCTTVFKEFNLTKSGSKPVVKRRKSFGKENLKRPQNNSKKVVFAAAKNAKSHIDKTNKLKKTLPLRDYLTQDIVRSKNASLKQLPYVHIIDTDNVGVAVIDEEKQSIEFEPSEFCKNLILQNKELSPSHFRRFTETGFTPSKIQSRPSVYKKIEFVADPYEFAMFEINRLEKLSPSRRYTQHHNIKICTPKKSPCFSRPSAYKQITPCDSILGSINLNYRTPCSVCPSTRKENSPNLSTRSYRRNLMRTTQKTQKISPDVDRRNKLENTDSLNINSFENKMSDICSKLDLLLVHQASETNNRVNAVSPSSSVSQLSNMSFNKNCKSSCANLKSENVCSIYRNFDQKQCFDPVPSFTKSCESDIYPSITQSVKSSHKLYTPRPISFYSNSRIHDHGSPLLPSRAYTQVSPAIHAPICTPLVLRNIARNSEDILASSPSLAICTNNFHIEIKNCHEQLKLEFQEEENTNFPTLYDDVYTGSSLSASELASTVNLENIVTKQKINDHLADQECALYMTILCGEHCGCHSSRNFCNPIAKVLKEGDEMADNKVETNSLKNVIKGTIVRNTGTSDDIQY